MSAFQSYHQQNEYEDEEGKRYLIEDMEIENPKRTSWCIESNEQQLREELIQRATNRLKRRMLEEDLAKIMEQIAVRQMHLEAVQMDTTTTIDIVTDISDNSDIEEINRLSHELQLLRKRLEAHKEDLEKLEPTSDHYFVVSSQDMAKTTSKVSNQSSTMSRLSSNSIFGRALSISSRATSIGDQSDSRSSVESINEQKRERRRRRIQYQRQKYQETLARATAMDDDYLSFLDGSENCSQSIWVSKNCIDHDAPFYDLAGKRSFKQGSFCGSVYGDTEQQFAPIPVPEQGHYIDTRSRRRRQKKLEQLRQKEQEEQQQQQQQQQQQHNQHHYHYHHQQHQDQQEYQYEHQHYYLQSQQLERDYPSDNEGSVVSNITFSSISTLSNLLPEIRHPLSVNTPVEKSTNDSYFQPKGSSSNDMQYYRNAMHAWLSDSDSVFEETQSIARIRKSIESYTYPDRNVLDEAMSFLDGLGEDGDDGGFGEDMYLLLHNPDLCCRPLSEIQNTMHELKQKQHFSIIRILFMMFWPGTYIQFFISAAYSAACTSLEWCRFLSILGAAVVISLLHGPKDLRSTR